jgi:hypothetical protein
MDEPAMSAFCQEPPVGLHMPNMRRSLALHAAAMKSGSGRRRRCEEEEIVHAAYRPSTLEQAWLASLPGVLCIPLQAPGSWRFRVYAGSLMAMPGFVAAAIGVLWADLELASRLVFSGLFGLRLYMAWRAYRARARLRQPVSGWRPRYLDDVGFTLISLFGGLVIVAAIDLGLSAWLVALIALGGVADAICAMNRVKARLSAQRPVDSTGTMGSGLTRSGAERGRPRL